jgi:hypothetical protein
MSPLKPIDGDAAAEAGGDDDPKKSSPSSAGAAAGTAAGATVGVGFSFGFACSCGRFVAAAGCTLERGDAEDVREAGTAETLDPVAEPNPGDANVVNALGGSVTHFIVSARVCVCVCVCGSGCE